MILCPVEKRSQHLGLDGIYLDDITDLEPEVAALYFPKRCQVSRATLSFRGPSGSCCVGGRSARHVLFLLSDGGSGSVKGDSEMVVVGVRSTNLSPLSVGSSGMDSGVDGLLDQISDLPHVAISLCGGLTDSKEITRGRKETYKS